MTDKATETGSKAYLRSLRELQAYRLDLRYIGAGFHGWQSQPNGQGIQDCVERALQTILRHPVRVIAAARTDSGVHAEHQVAIFHTAAPFNQHKWLKALNALLPPSIGIAAIVPVSSDFHPIYSAAGKIYRYSFWTSAARHPAIDAYVWRIGVPFDYEFFMAEAKTLLGRHDFTSFCAGDSSAKTKERTILAIDLVQKGDLVEFWILGHGFLKQMIRIIVGSLIDACNQRASGAMQRILQQRNRLAAGRTAPGQGLCLVEIFYGAIPAIAEVRQKTGFTFRLGP